MHFIICMSYLNKKIDLSAYLLIQQLFSESVCQQSPVLDTED